MKSAAKKVRKIFLAPNNFFVEVGKQKEIKPVVIFYLLLLLFSTLASLISVLVITVYVSNITPTAGDLGDMLLNSSVQVVVGLLLGFVWAFLLHCWLKVFKGKGNYHRSYQIFVYGSVPSLLLSWVPVVNILASLYGFYLIYLGAIVLHKMPKRRVVIALAVLFALAIGLQYLRIPSQ